jgi:hypothetical protein
MLQPDAGFSLGKAGQKAGSMPFICHDRFDGTLMPSPA